MANFDFGLLSVLVAEDNQYMRSMLRTVLRALGVGTVTVASDGGAAIEILRNLKDNPQKAGVSTIDVVFSNWQMEPVDGMMLLKWVRRHKESPDRFMPFVMVSGFSDRKRVELARDFGVTEFVGKPYTINSLMARVNTLVNAPRQFVLTADYFGPDRRRNRETPPGPERRVITDDEIEVIYDDR